MMFITCGQKSFKVVVTLLLVGLGSGALFGGDGGIGPARAAPIDLFFSEYIEGTDENKALEIFNGTEAAIDLAASGYEVRFFLNGATDPSITIVLTGLVGPADVYVLADDGAGQDILGQADQLSSDAFFNGNDAVALSKGGVLIDVIGQIGVDPGTEWGEGLASTADNTLRRKISVAAGDPDGGNPFDPAAEWDGFATDTFADLGRHSLAAPPPPPSALTLVISEVAWSGTGADANDEWIELHNPGSEPVDLAGWMLSGNGDGQPVEISLEGVIEGGGYWLLERQDDGTIADIEADQIYAFRNGLANDGESLQLQGPDGTVIDTTNGDGGAWPGGSGSPDYLSMERIDPLALDGDENWRGNDTMSQNGLDAEGNPVHGTPRQPNSEGETPPPPPPPVPPPPLTVVINEIAWSGTAANSSDEWLELLNRSDQPLSLDGWVITSTNGLNIALDGTALEPQAYYLIERTDDSAVSDIPADMTANFGSGLRNEGDSLFLSAHGVVIDTANVDGGSWPGGSAAPGYFSLERIDPALPDSEANWDSNDGLIRNGLDAASNPINGTPKQVNAPPAPPPTPTPPPAAGVKILIGEFLYDGQTPSSEGDEFIELCNPQEGPVDLAGYKVGDEEAQGGGESMYALPAGMTLEAGACLTIAKSAADFQARFGFAPNLEAGGLAKYTAWGRGSWSLANEGDELLVLGPNDEILDSVAYRNGEYGGLGLEPGATAPEPHSLQRVWAVDTESMPHDFVRTEPNPGVLTAPPPPPAAAAPPALLPDGMQAYWGHLHAHTTYSDGAGPPYYALAMARAAGLHFFAITDHDWWLTEAEWGKTLNQSQNATAPGEFIALRGIEWTHETQGHINIFNNDTLISRDHPLFSDLSNLYTWLAANPQVVAQFNHPDPNYGGTFQDFAFHPAAASTVFLQEIGNSAQSYTTYEPSFIRSNTLGWRVGPSNNSDSHTARWGTDTATRTGLVAPALSEQDLLAAMRARRVFATEDSNLALALRLNGAWMGTVLPPAGGEWPLVVDIVDPDPEPATILLYDRNLLLAAIPLPTSTGQWQTMVELLPGHYFWVKVVQADGDVAYSTPIWVEGEAPVETLYINEVLPAPADVDWDGDGSASYQDEWVELFNPGASPVGLGGWQLRDGSGSSYELPLELTVPARGFATLYYRQFGFGLNNGSESLSLIRPNGTAADAFSYEHSPGYDESWCRLPDGGEHWSHDCIASPNGPNRERGPAEPLAVKIYEAKRLSYDAWVRVSGRVTAPPELLGSRMMYIQDETAGILIYLPKEHGLFFNLGDKVRVEGNLRTFREEFEIAVRDDSDVKFLEPGSPPPPLPVATTSLLEPYEGLLVLLQGQAVRFSGRGTMWIDDGTDPAKIVIRPTTGIRKPFIKPGTVMSAVGIVSQYSDPAKPLRDDYRLLPRYAFDLVLPAEAPQAEAPASWPGLLPETGR